MVQGLRQNIGNSIFVNAQKWFSQNQFVPVKFIIYPIFSVVAVLIQWMINQDVFLNTITCLDKENFIQNVIIMNEKSTRLLFLNRKDYIKISLYIVFNWRHQWNIVSKLSYKSLADFIVVYARFNLNTDISEHIKEKFKVTYIYVIIFWQCEWV